MMESDERLSLYFDDALSKISEAKDVALSYCKR